MVALYFGYLTRGFLVNPFFSAVYLRLMNQPSIFISNSTTTCLDESLCWQWNLWSKAKTTPGKLNQGSQVIKANHYLSTTFQGRSRYRSTPGRVCAYVQFQFPIFILLDVCRSCCFKELLLRVLSLK